MIEPIKIVHLDFTTLQFFEKYVVSVVREDMDVDMDFLEQLQSETKNFYQDDFYGYISDRRNHYSINPLVHLRTHPTLVGMAIVCDSHLKEMTATFEQRFFSKPFQIFNDLNLAQNWMEDLVDRISSGDTSISKKTE